MIGQQAAKVLDNWDWFLTSTHGVWALNYFYPETKSDKVEGKFQSLNVSGFNNAAAVQDGYMYRVSLPKSGSAYNNCQMVFDPLANQGKGSWTYFEGQNISYFAKSIATATIWGGDSVNGNVYIINQGSTDNGTGIPLDYSLAPFDGAESFSQKIPIWAILYTENSGTSQISFSYSLDDMPAVAIVPSAQQGVNVWSNTLGTGNLVWGNNPNNPNDLWTGSFLLSNKMPMHGKGRFFSCRLYSAGVTSRIDIRRVDVAFVFLLPN
jgi:hypothetical protein